MFGSEFTISCLCGCLHPNMQMSSVIDDSLMGILLPEMQDPLLSITCKKKEQLLLQLLFYFKFDLKLPASACAAAAKASASETTESAATGASTAAAPSASTTTSATAKQFT